MLALTTPKELGQQEYQTKVAQPSQVLQKNTTQRETDIPMSIKRFRAPNKIPSIRHGHRPLRQHFTCYSLQTEVMTDNSPFCAADFTKFCEVLLSSTNSVMLQVRRTERSPKWCMLGETVNYQRSRRKQRLPSRQTRVKEYTVEAAGSVACTNYLRRRTQTLLPTTNQLLDTPTSNSMSATLQDAKARQVEYYNHRSKEWTSVAVWQTKRVKYNDRMAYTWVA